jgi:hypothetical protein
LKGENLALKPIERHRCHGSKNVKIDDLASAPLGLQWRLADSSGTALLNAASQTESHKRSNHVPPVRSGL